MRQLPAAQTHIRPRMGTLLALTVCGRRPGALNRDIATAFDTASRYERLMSHHDPHSQLSRLNAAAGRQAGVRVRELAPILRVVRRLARTLEGAFDPSVAPLAQLWRRAARRGAIPAPRSLDATRALVSLAALRVRGGRAKLDRHGMALDLGGFGKGLTLDRIGAALARRRCPSAILNFGESSLLAIGRFPAGGWPIALRGLRGGFAGEFNLRRRACSTSAALGRSVVVGGRRFGHVLDPRSGRPLLGAAQVTVLARSAAVAEAASTALLVLGPAAMGRIARRLQVEVCWIDGAGVRTTRGFRLRRQARNTP